MTADQAPTPNRGVGGSIAMLGLAAIAVAVLLFAAFGGATSGGGSTQGVVIAESEVLPVGGDTDDIGETAAGEVPPPPTSGQPACSQPENPSDPAGPRQELPAEVEATVAAVSSAARTCDVGALAALMVDDFVYAFGQSGRAQSIDKYRGLEDAGEPVTAIIAGLLELMPAITADGTYVWPKQTQWSQSEWAEMPDADLDALTQVFGQEAVGEWLSTGEFTGYRLGISADGGWFFFLDS